LTSPFKVLVNVDQILRIISFELSEILLDISGNVKAECSALREIYVLKTTRKYDQKKS
jgi:hypothetical protein